MVMYIEDEEFVDPVHVLSRGLTEFIPIWSTCQSWGRSVGGGTAWISDTKIIKMSLYALVAQ